ncbi:PIN domain-containing protein [Moraxella caviae]|uniref:PIN domain-containing protein n=1 Tax=Moraxella caviae TaxID=34060 RepID=UPI0011C08144|nr:PIN domain-containing protein [Moraxella caviae]
MLLFIRITLFELERGILQKARKDKQQADVLRRWFDHQIKAEFGERVLSLDANSALKTAHLHIPNPAPLADSFLAGTAIAHHLILVTRNTKDFIGFDGIHLLNPFE